MGEVYHGLSLQLAVYMNAALEMEQRTHAGKEIVPAAMALLSDQGSDH